MAYRKTLLFVEDEETWLTPPSELGGTLQGLGVQVFFLVHASEKWFLTQKELNWWVVPLVFWVRKGRKSLKPQSHAVMHKKLSRCVAAKFPSKVKFHHFWQLFCFSSRALFWTVASNCIGAENSTFHLLPARRKGHREINSPVAGGTAINCTMRSWLCHSKSWATQARHEVLCRAFFTQLTLLQPNSQAESKSSALAKTQMH